jgi:hypothetical protein
MNQSLVLSDHPINGHLGIRIKSGMKQPPILGVHFGELLIIILVKKAGTHWLAVELCD